MPDPEEDRETCNLVVRRSKEVSMESFADKVRYGHAPRFDPMLEERGRWVSGEAPRHDTEMEDTVIEGLAEASLHTAEGEFNPFKGYNGEILPSNLERSFSGFLVRKDAVKFQVNSEKLLARIELKDQLLIGKFVGPKPNPHAMKLWIQTLNQELRGNDLTFCRNVGKGFFILKGEDRDALHSAMMLSPFRSKWGTCMLQSWVPGFNPDNPSNLAFPTWVSLRNMPYEHEDQAIAIAESLGEVIGFDTANESTKDPRFCVNLDISKGWATCIELVCEGGILPPQKIMIDYDKLPIRCRACLSWKHKASECNIFHKKPGRGKGRSTHFHHTPYQEKTKNVERDEDGFQQVRNRRGIRRNIFDFEKDSPIAKDPDSRNADKELANDPRNDTGAATTVAVQNEDDRSGGDQSVIHSAPKQARTEELGPRNHTIELTSTPAPNSTPAVCNSMQADDTGEKIGAEGVGVQIVAEKDLLRPGETGQATQEESGAHKGQPDQGMDFGADEGREVEAETTQRGSKEMLAEGDQFEFETNTRCLSVNRVGQKRSNAALDTTEEGDSEPEEETEERRKDIGAEEEEDSWARQEAPEVTDRGCLRGKEGCLELVTLGEAEEMRQEVMVVVDSRSTPRESRQMHRPHQGQRSVGTRGKEAMSSDRVEGELPPLLLQLNLRDRQNRGGEPKSARIGNKSQRLNEQGDALHEVGMFKEGKLLMGTDPAHSISQGKIDVIPETQLTIYNNSKDHIYKDMLASIGLDSPTSSRDTWDEEESHAHAQGQTTPLANTPIRNSANSLLALGKHTLTPRQGRLWEHRNKSPLGGKVTNG